MSYVLDALKKTQAAQTGDPISVKLTPVSRRTNLPVVILSVALFANVVLVSAYLLFGRSESSILATEAPSIKRSVPESTPRPDATRANPARLPVLAISPEQPIKPSQDAPEPAPRQAAVNQVPETTQPKTRALIDVFTITDLAPGERAAYADLSFTSHIYTEAKDLRALVIDGERVKIGDRFKALTIYDITETGVIFEENQDGHVRRIEIRPFE